MNHKDIINNGEQLKELKEIKNIMNKSMLIMSKKSGVSLIIWGSVWFIGFMLTHFYYSYGQIIWTFLVALGAIVSVLVEIFIYRRRKKQKTSGNKWKVILSIFGILLFDALIVFTFNLTSHIEITILLIYSNSVCYFLLGIFKSNLVFSFASLISAISIFLTNMFFPSLFYLLAAIFFGGIYIVCGISLILKKEKSYE